MNTSKKVTNGLISVIMPAYNAEKFIGEAIESILKQTYTNFELIIIEDCSTDNTATIIGKYSEIDSRIQAIYKKENRGVKGFIDNLNEGIELSRGEFIARMDADDISMPDRFQKQIDFLNDNNGVLLVGGGAIGINENGNVLGRVRPAINVSLELPTKDVIMHPTVMMRNGFAERYRLTYCEDYDLWLQFLKNGKRLCNLPHPLIKYRILNNSLSNKSVIRTYGASLLAQRIYNETLLFEEASPDVLYQKLISGTADKSDYRELLQLGFKIPSLELIEQLYGIINHTDLKILNAIILFFLKIRRTGGNLRRCLLNR